MLLGGIACLGLAAYLNFRPEQPWILWLTAGLVAMAVDGIVRTHAVWEDDGPFSTVVYLLLPALTTLGIGYFVDDAVTGYARLGLALLGSSLVGFVAYGEYHSVDISTRLYGSIRLILAVVTYLTAFALYTVIFSRDLDLPVAALLVATISMALSVELLRESHLTARSSMLVGLAVGVSLGELRLVLYFFAHDGLLAGALLIIGFYLATGLVHHLLDHDLEFGTAAEYLLVASVGTAAVVFTRVFV